MRRASEKLPAKGARKPKETRGISVLIGGEAGQGIESSGLHLGRFFNEYGYDVFVYKDYQSVIRGGHNFSIIRASEESLCNEDRIDAMIALNNDCARHLWRLKSNGILICDESFRLKTTQNLRIARLPFAEIEKKFGKIFLNSFA